MKIREYMLIKDDVNHPKLEELRCIEWDGDLSCVDENYRMLNEVFKVNKLNEEYSYVIALDHQKKPKGVYQVGHGSPNESLMSLQNIFTFLLLTGANAFIVAHNHVSNMPEASDNDKLVTYKITNMALTFDIEFITHIIVYPNGYTTDGGNIKDEKEIEYLENGKAAIYVFGDRIEGDVETIEQMVSKTNEEG